MSHGRVVSNQIPGHQGNLGTPAPFGLRLHLPRDLGTDLRLQVVTKLPEPLLGDPLFVPRCTREKTAQPRQTRCLAHLPQQFRKHPSAFALHQPQQHGHEVLVLGFTQVLTVALRKVAHLFIQTYNGNRHRTPPWFQAFVFSFLIPHGVLSHHSPLQKCKHRVPEMGQFS